MIQNEIVPILWSEELSRRSADIIEEKETSSLSLQIALLQMLNAWRRKVVNLKRLAEKEFLRGVFAVVCYY